MNTLSEKYRQKMLFAFFTFIPLFLSFILPPIFYKYPLMVSIFLIQLPTQIVFLSIGLVITWFALLLSAIIFIRIPLPEKPRPWRNKNLFSIMVCFSIAGFLYDITDSLIKIPHSISVILLPLVIMPVLAITIGFYLKKHEIPHPKKTLIIFFILNAFILYFYPILNGDCYNVVYSLIALSYAYTLIQKNWRKSLVFILISLCAIAFAMVTKNYARDIKSAHPSHVIQYDYQLFQPRNNVNLPDNSVLKYPKYALNRILGRLDHFTEFAYVVYTTPNKIPYLHGETYKTLLYTFIPRMLWHNKPIVGCGHAYGHRYGFTSDDDHVTCWAITMPTEGWVNFGWRGYILSAIIIGLILNFFWAFFIGNPNQLGNLILATVLVYCASQGESNTSMTIGATIHALLFYWVLDIILRSYFRRH